MKPCLVALLPTLTLALGCSAPTSAPAGAGASSGSPGAGGGSGQGAGTAAGGMSDIIVDPNPPGSGGAPTDGSEPDCDAVLEVIYRDFNADHPDFEETYKGQDDVGCGMVAAQLDTAGGRRQPTFQAGVGTGQRMVTAGVISCITPWPYGPPKPEITGPDTFADWYNDVPGVNMTVEDTLPLTATGTGTFVFDSKNSPSGRFFPLDGKGFNELVDSQGQKHNFHFTTEAHMRFGYKSGQKFTFSGDDDLWIFVNDRLALDLGGLHGPITATLDFDAQASELGIVPNNTYSMDIFHAERHTDESNFRIETNISCFETVVVVR